MALNDPNGLLFDDSNNRRLVEIFAPVFTLILQLRAARDLGDNVTLRERILALLDRAGSEARRAGTLGEDVDAARFALVAFIDETLLSSDWHLKDQWMMRPLQLELYERMDAGEEFFTRHEQLRKNAPMHTEVLEIFFMCMALGFKGQFILHRQEQLRQLIEDSYAELARAPGMRDGLLAPHGKPRDQVTTEVKKKVPAWAVAAVAVAFGLIVYFSMSMYITSTAEQTARNIPVPAATEQLR